MSSVRSLSTGVSRSTSPDHADASETFESASFSTLTDPDLVDQPLMDETVMVESVHDNRREKAGHHLDSDGLIPVILKSWGSLLYLLSLVAVVVSILFFGSWFPAMMRSTGLDCSSFSPLACPGFPKFHLQKLHRQIDSLEVHLKKRTVNIEKLGHRLYNLETHLGDPESEIEELRKQLADLGVRLGRLLQKSQMVVEPNATRPSVRQINWLSFDLGARAITQLSSPVEYPQQKTKAMPLPTVQETRGWNFLGRLLTQRHEVVEEALTPPARFKDINYGLNSVLQPWLENEPRYCTAGRKVQLAARLTRPITPVNLVMEYYLKEEVPAVGAAPKEVELWIPISNDTARAEVMRSITTLYPDILAGPTNGTDQFPGQENDGLDVNLVPVGRWTYDIHAGVIAQNFFVPIELEAHGVAVDNVVIRVKSNWGRKDMTCLVRTRLYGKDQSGLRERLEAH